MRLVGIGQTHLPTGVARTAILVGHGDTLVFATTGEPLPGDFRVDRVDALSIRVIDEVSGESTCLTLASVESGACNVSVASNGDLPKHE